MGGIPPWFAFHEHADFKGLPVHVEKRPPASHAQGGDKFGVQVRCFPHSSACALCLVLASLVSCVCCEYTGMHTHAFPRTPRCATLRLATSRYATPRHSEATPRCATHTRATMALQVTFIGGLDRITHTSAMKHDLDAKLVMADRKSAHAPRQRPCPMPRVCT